ncbi:hypothetical protein PHYPSEUDO_004191 [Phytophthora pseudosyringae]|uniref:C2H2-type domain-containing protein n=1 Tax=Phytophthora pseudosyringae TaxID=221518 RepID=A0A8T1VPU0_9STRA|nr:hypothetical protein PHYPSEUDO_004191 [Phytophthora pseudosyringae]
MSTALAAARAKTEGKRMLRNALDAYGDEDTSLSKWNARKKSAVDEGKWVWRQSVANANAAIKSRFDKEEVQTTLKARFVDSHAAVDEEMSSTIHVDQHGGQLGQNDLHDDQCCWRERIGGKTHYCTNLLPLEKKKKKTDPATPQDPLPAPVAPTKHFCPWHAKECGYGEHPMEKSRAIEIPNEYGMCLHCYEATASTLRATLQKVPPRIGALKIPGVCEANARKEVKRDAMLKLPGKRLSVSAGRKLGPASLCAWQKEHSEITYVWRCTNCVLMHPVLRGSYLSFCGFHAPRCIQEYGNKGKNEQACPSMDRKNRFGLCRNHLEAHLSILSFEERGSVLLIDSDFDVPGIKECKKEEVVVPVVRHPLAPKNPPPVLESNTGLSFSMDTTSAVAVLPLRLPRTPLDTFMKEARALVGKVIHEVLDHPNPVSVVVKEVIWRVQFLRRAEVVATRIQRIFRGNRARRRVKLLLYEQAAMDRIMACRVLQRFVRGFLGRRRFEHEHENVLNAVPHIQRLLRGGLARKHFRELCAAIRLQRNYRWYRQRLLARACREEVAYMQGLQRQADINFTEMETQMDSFRRLRARRILRSQIMRWKKRQEVHEQEVAERLRSLLGTVKIQRQWRRHHRYMLIKKRYGGAQMIQKRVRGWLTRRMWFGDPGVHFVTSFVSLRSGFKYGKIVVESQSSRSYSYPSQKIRTRCGVLTIQRVFRGHLGRLAANSRWADMLKRWEWLGITPTDSSGQLSDSMVVGHRRYGFVLPSFAYHKDRRQHMRPIANEPVPNRGHAYKYQYILDLIKDRDGKRGWSLAREELYTRQLKEEQEWMRAEEACREAKEAEIAMKELRRHIATVRDPLAQSMSMSKAVFPVGTIVDVVGKMEGKSIIRRAKIVAIHQEKQPNGEKNASFDVEYTQALRNSFGRLEASGEQRVSVARLRHIPFVRTVMNSKRNVGVLIQAAIDCLRREIESGRQPTDGLSTEVSTDPASENGGDESEETLSTVDAIADRLRDCRTGHNLLHDHRDFVNFVFRNSTLLKLKWLLVVSQVRYGTRFEKSNPAATVNPLPSAPLIEMFYREFGMTRTKHTDDERVIRPMPERAHAIEERMAKLGFQYDSKANAHDDSSSSKEEEPAEDSTRPETTPVFKKAAPRHDSAATVDDMMLFREDPTPQNAQDMHRLIYELKTLPREGGHEKIIHIASRRAHAYVCGHPACGKCFSSRKMARLHQLNTHEGRERLATGNPLVDQYVHAYWPQGTPWTEADIKTMVGYFACKWTGCETVQFRTRRELSRHRAQEHGIKDDNYDSNSSCATRSPAPTLSEETGHTKRFTLTRRAIWLGSYVVCRNLEAKLGIGPTALMNPRACSVHDKPVQLCTACFLQQRRPASPFRLYSAFAVRRAEPGIKPLRIEADAPAEASLEEEYMIIRDDDEEFCPAVNIWGVYSLTAPPTLKGNEKVILPDPLASVLYLKVTTICRDALGEAWIFGSVLAQRKQSGSRAAGQVGDEHEVVPDKARGLVFALLSQVVGSASIHYCSRNVFYRKYYAKTGDGSEAVVIRRKRIQSMCQDRDNFNLDDCCQAPVSIVFCRRDHGAVIVQERTVCCLLPTRGRQSVDFLPAELLLICKFASFQQHTILHSTPTMKIALLLALAAFVASTDAAVPAVPTDRMAQFLQEKSGLESELSTWKQSDAGQFAKDHGFIPASSARDAGAAEDEELRRLFLTKLLIEGTQATNPEATFSTDTPFTLMTEEEFTKFVGASYQRGSGLLPDTSPAGVIASNSTEIVGTEKDWTNSGCVVGVKNQGQCGSCWAFAAVAALESAICLAGRPLTPLSEQQLLDCDESSYACQGGFPGDALTFIQRSGGVCTEEAYPYVSGETGDRDTCQSSCTAETVPIRKVVSVPQSDAGLVQAINGRPVAVGVAAGNPTWKQYKGGVVSSCTTSELDHAVLAVGYTASYFKIKNSWGTQWGEAGYIRLKRGAGTSSSGTCGVVGPKSVYPQL